MVEKKKYINIPKNIFIAQCGNHAFINYKKSNKFAKENCWNNWVNSKDTIVTEYENTPISGFKIKDCKEGWYSYKEKPEVIINDPHGFDISISLTNLAWIIHHYTHDVNKGFIGDFVYGWDGVELKLIPTISEDYKYTKEVDDELTNYKLKDCIVGEVYKFPNDKAMIYLGYIPIIYSKILGNYGHRNIELMKKKFHCFKKLDTTTCYNPYEIISSTKKFLIKANNDIYSIESVEQFIKEMYTSLWGNANIEDPDVVNIAPIDDNNEKRINQLKKYINSPYKHWKTSGYLNNNCNCGLGIWVFNKERTEVYQYFMETEVTVNGMIMCDYVSKRRSQVANAQGVSYYDIKPDQFENEFEQYAKKEVKCYASYKYKLIGNTIIEEDILNHNSILLNDLIQNESANIYIAKSYLDNFEKCIKLVNKSGFEFMINI